LYAASLAAAIVPVLPGALHRERIRSGFVDVVGRCVGSFGQMYVGNVWVKRLFFVRTVPIWIGTVIGYNRTLLPSIGGSLCWCLLVPELLVSWALSCGGDYVLNLALDRTSQPDHCSSKVFQQFVGLTLTRQPEIRFLNGTSIRLSAVRCTPGV